ncbi:hypothetical protein ACET3Z_001866 [Daucus carota]
MDCKIPKRPWNLPTLLSLELGDINFPQNELVVIALKLRNFWSRAWTWYWHESYYQPGYHRDFYQPAIFDLENAADCPPSPACV